MQNYLLPEDDRLPARVFGPWVIEKLDYLARYIDIFGKSMHTRPWRKRHYIDLFAGSGKCRSDEAGPFYLGSPLLALATTHPFTNYFFVDSEAENIATLRKRCTGSSLYPNMKFDVGDGNVIVHKIVEEIQNVDREFLKGQWPSLNLAFLDPNGLELHWETIVALAKPSRMDLIIHYSQMGLSRNLGKQFEKPQDNSIDLFFGDQEWRKIYRRYRDKEESFIHRRLMDHYKEKLQGLGYKEVFGDDEVGTEPLIRNAKTNAPLYRLLFASKHELGQKFWRDVTRRDVHGQTRLPTM